MKTPLKILLLEDNRTDAEIIQRFLTKDKPFIEIKHVLNKKEFLRELKSFSPDVVLSDHALPQFNSADALAMARQQYPGIPFIMITGTVSEEFAVDIIKSGADDYILKDRINRLPLAIENALNQRKIQQEKEEALEKLIQSEEKYRTIFLQSPLPKWIYDQETLRFLEINEAAIRHYGYSREEFLTMTIKEIRPQEDIQPLMNDLKEIEAYPDIRQSNWTHRKKNGDLIIVETTAHSIEYNNRKGRMVVAKDITEKIKAEEELKRTNERFEMVVSSTNDVIWDWNMENDEFWWNENYYTYFGYERHKSPPDIISWYEGFYPDDKERVLAGIHTSIKDKKEFWTDEYRFLKADGTVAFVLDCGYILYTKTKKPYRMVGAMLDITDRKKAEEELQKSFGEKTMLAERMSTILNTLPANIALLDEKGLIVDINDSWRNYAGNPSFIGSNYGIGDNYINISKIRSEKDQSQGVMVANGIADVLDNKVKEFIYEYASDSPGTKKWFRMVATPLQGKEYAGAVVMHIDISELRRLEQERIENKIEEQKKITGAMLQAQEQERNAIGIELHDNVNQILAVTIMQLSMTKSKPDSTMEYIDTATKYLQSAIEENRKIAHALVVPDFKTKTLVDQVLGLTDVMLVASGIRVNLDMDRFQQHSLNDQQQLTVYRILQEQCNNIIKYAKAKTVNITFYTGENLFKMNISDDGQGMDPGKQSKGIGLRNINSRLSLLGGTAVINSPQGKGFALEITIPVFAGDQQRRPGRKKSRN